MSLINIISVATPFGNKEIEIHNGDITDFNWPVDLLVISAFNDAYNPVPNTVIEALQNNCNVVVKELAEQPFFNFKTPLNCWINKPQTDQYFSHIMCLEGIKREIQLTGTSNISFDNLFGIIALLPYKGLKIETVIMPLLGTGQQAGSIQDVLPVLLEKSINALNTNPKLKTIIFIEKDLAKAKLIDAEVNQLCKRNSYKTENLYTHLQLVPFLSELSHNLAKLKSDSGLLHQTIDELINELKNKEIRFFELGIQSRKILELILSKWLPNNSDNPNTIHDKIVLLKQMNVAEWVISNIHTIRVYGNYAAHSDSKTSIPTELNEKDIAIFIQAFNNFIDFYITNIQPQ
jgi:hypothetical protein